MLQPVLLELPFLLLLAPLLPLCFALVGNDRIGQWLLPVAALPALVAAFVLPVGTSVALPWVLLGAQWGLDATGQVFLLVTALLWLLAGLYSVSGTPAGASRWRFRVFFLLTLSGNVLLVIAQDMGSFFLGFALMGLAAYGLIAQQASVTTRRAGRIYLIWTVLGEVLLFAGAVFTASAVGSVYFSEVVGKELPLAAVILVTLGLGIKVALPGLHVWLPIAHGAAPPAVSALLSGVMVKAGILGLVRFLPAGAASTVWVAEWLVWLGLVGAFYGVVFGLRQTAPKVILAYSTMSQLGVLILVTGLVLQAPADAALVMALLLYVAHHAWVKGALFLGVGLFKQTLSWWLLGVLVVLALVLIGVPLTSGALAKGSVKAALPADWQHLALGLWLSSLATTLLMGRFVWSLWRYRRQHGGASSHHTSTSPGLTQWLGWAILVEWVLWWPFLFALPAFKWWDVLPILLGLGMVALALLPRIPAGDVPVLLAHAGYRGWHWVRQSRSKHRHYLSN
ncbi:complex I subunit 5 family protein [Thiothrix subterranea]|uniref:Complex I subunit 5 family protein n=1 Tax=Thiothrix subterranea TaxID=2735563 RepID=A0ABU0Y2J0_9GAMM|nr:complex I subunit 5 family protein [Thiothrix subterranea]MDQ5766909.1 complex I subunit 5 family protein [Thiothrix subterranea]